jgi:hypothetical protein
MRPGQFDDPADRRRGRDQAHAPVAQLGAPPGYQQRPQSGAVHEGHPGHVEKDPGAALAHDPQQDLLQRVLCADVNLSADRHDDAVASGADRQG